MDDWSLEESDLEYAGGDEQWGSGDTDRATAGPDPDAIGTGQSGDGDASERRFRAILQWAVTTLRVHPIVFGVATTATTVAVLAPGPNVVRLGLSVAGAVLVTAVAAVVADDALADRTPGPLAQGRVVAESLSQLVVLLVFVLVNFYLFVALPTMIARLSGLLLGVPASIAIGVAAALAAIMVVLNLPFECGKSAVRESRLSTVGVFSVFVLAFAPVVVRPAPGAALVAGLVLWSGGLTAVAGLAWAKLVLAQTEPVSQGRRSADGNVPQPQDPHTATNTRPEG